MKPKWIIRTQDEQTVRQLCREHGLPEAAARLLCNRGVTGAEEVRKFFSDDLYGTLHDPFLLRDMEPTAARIRQAIERKEKITVYGDYDVDGITSTVSLYTYLRAAGGVADYYIPSRLEEGYGLNREALERIRDRGTRLMITVDTGTTAPDEVEYAKSLGLDVLITDHHECMDALPNCPVVNPKRKDNIYPFPGLAGVGVVFKLICACMGDPRAAFEHYGALTAIGTISDIMPLTDENRLIVREGLRLLRTSPPPGIRALMEIQGSGDEIDAGTVAFQIAPLMNAAGRMGDPGLSVRLLLSADREEALELARELNDCNLARKEREQAVVQDIDRLMAGKKPKDKILVYGSPEWHNGVIGIAASRLAERYCRPCVLVCFEGEAGKGSARSVRGVNLFELMSRASEKLDNFGGHEMAVGLTLARKNFDAFVRQITDEANRSVGEEALQPVYEAEYAVPPEEVSISFAESCEILEPCGNGNPSPQFVIPGLSVENIRAVGGGKHTRLQLRGGRQSLTAMYFGKMPEELECTEGDRVDLMCSIRKRFFQSRPTLSITVRDLRLSPDPEDEKHRQNYRRFREGEALPEEEKITREDVAALYRWVTRRSAPGNPVRVADRRLAEELQKSIPAFSLCRLLLCLDVLTELRLLSVEGEHFIRLEPMKTTTKADLTKASRWAELCRG